MFRRDLDRQPRGLSDGDAMASYITGRLMAAVPVLLFVTVAVFAFVHFLPGDPVLAMLGENPESIDPVALNLARKELGLDKPVPVQYAIWMKGVATGDFGRSVLTRQPVTKSLQERLPVTVEISIASFIVGLAIAIPAGVITAVRRNSWVDRVTTVLGLGGVAMPSFWLAILLILVFAVKLRWLPPSGFVSVFADPVEGLRYLALPAIVLGSSHAAVVMRQLRSSLLEVLGQDYVRTARAKGLDERRVILLHALRNALLPVLTVMGLQVGRILGGSVVVETVFAIPGLGRYGVSAIFGHDYPVVQATVLMAAVAVVLANLATDLLYGVLDPRIRLA
jgi:peptide/nickel transport system permease protein